MLDMRRLAKATGLSIAGFIFISLFIGMVIGAIAAFFVYPQILLPVILLVFFIATVVENYKNA